MLSHTLGTLILPISVTGKSALRGELRRKRAGLGMQQRRHAAERVALHALSARLVARGRRIGFYMPTHNELDILPLLNRALWMGIECYLPVVPGPRRKRLWFTRLGGASDWTHNRYEIPEYGVRQRKMRIAMLDVVFMPLLGFDRRGYRMGMGGGYYDASLAYLSRRQHWHRPRLVGVGFEIQKCDHIPEDPWDIRLDAVITERGVYRFGAVRAKNQ